MQSSLEQIEDTEYSRYAWIRSIRYSKNIMFCACTDGLKEFQVTIKENTEVNGDLKVGSCIMVYGEDSTTPRGLYEFLAIIVHVIGTSDDAFPIQPKEHSDEFLRTIPELRGRTLKYADRWKARSLASFAVHDFFNMEGYCQYFTPIITQADCEGAGETFKATSDWLSADLTVSGQLHLEVGMMSLGRVYNFQPCFRAEKSATRKHLAEFWMIEAEALGFDLESTMDLCESLVKHVLLRTTSLIKIGEYNARIIKTADPKQWPRITYTEACQKCGVSEGEDIGSEQEKMLTTLYDGPVFVTHYPKGLKPFYMRKEDGYARCFDLIFPDVGELAGGSEREYEHEKLEQAMRDSGMDMEKMQWYLNTRKWGTVPHAGFGLGFERLIMFITGADKVHDVIPFPVSF